MTREDMNLAAASESVKAQCNLDDNVCDEVSARFLSGIDASKHNRRFRLRRIALATTAVILGAQFSGPSIKAEPSNKPIGILLAAGDIAQCKQGRPKGRPDDGYRQQDTADLLGKEISAANAAGIPIRVLALGDLAYDEGTADQFENCFHKSWGQHIKYILPVPGNHEYEFSNEATPYFDYFKKYDRKMVSENGPKAGYYSLNFPDDEELAGREIKPWRLIALNSKKGTPPPNQLDWLKNDLKSNRHRCVLVFAHFFAFSSSRHGHEPPSFKSADLKNPAKKAKNAAKDPKPDPNMVKQTLYASGASLLLSGHDHGYEQFVRQNGYEQFTREDATQHPISAGVRSFIVGTGGATFYKERYKYIWPNGAKPQFSHGILKLELFETRYRWQFVPIDREANDVPSDLKTPTQEDCNSRKSPTE
jgi:3',5'-cyclic AMP phosphodiesterase CpdA